MRVIDLGWDRRLCEGFGAGWGTALDHLKEGTQEMKICWDAWGLWFVCDDNDILVRDR
jgi:hypothetical protein